MDENKENITGEQLDEAVVNKTLITKCPNCGGNMVYDPESKALKCQYCGSIKPLDFAHISHEIEIDNLFNSHEAVWDEVHIYKCNNCGATEVISRKELSVKCPFCGTSNVVRINEVSGLKPNAVLPFIITKEDACNKAIVWVKKKFFAPKSFKKSAHPEDTFGNYYPAFTFDSDTSSMYKGRLGKYYYETVRVNGKSVRKRKIRYFNIDGNQNVRFDDLLVQATNEDSRTYLNKIAPFNTNNSQEYNPDFLQGFSATHYTKNGKQCWVEAKNTMKKYIEKEILKRYTYDVVDYINLSTNYSNTTYKYVLLPVYIGHFNYSKKIYNYYINGQSGKVSGKTPVSILKVSILILIIIGVIVLFGLLYYLGEYGGE